MRKSGILADALADNGHAIIVSAKLSLLKKEGQQLFEGQVLSRTGMETGRISKVKPGKIVELFLGNRGFSGSDEADQFMSVKRLMHLETPGKSDRGEA
jgi:hypothetical protein